MTIGSAHAVLLFEFLNYDLTFVELIEAGAEVIRFSLILCSIVGAKIRSVASQISISSDNPTSKNQICFYQRKLIFKKHENRIAQNLEREPFRVRQRRASPKVKGHRVSFRSRAALW